MNESSCFDIYITNYSSLLKSNGSMSRCLQILTNKINIRIDIFLKKCYHIKTNKQIFLAVWFRNHSDQREVRCKSVATIITVIEQGLISRNTHQAKGEVNSIFGYEKCSRFVHITG